MPEVLTTLLIAAASVLTLFFVIWIIHLPLKNAAIVDVGWGLGFILLCLVFVWRGEGFNLRNTNCFLMVMLWGLRIVTFLVNRLYHEKHEDKRYQKFRNSWGKNASVNFLWFFETQAVLELFIAIPFLVVSLNPQTDLNVIEVAGAVLFAVALLGETLSDEQLHRFKSIPANKGKTCDVGLWRYSRHPNYFFEWLVWIGFFIYALPSPYGWTAFISPAIMYYLVRYVSGVPLAEEQSLRSRGDEYRRYQQTTSVFFPMPKRK